MYTSLTYGAIVDDGAGVSVDAVVVGGGVVVDGTVVESTDDVDGGAVVIDGADVGVDEASEEQAAAKVVAATRKIRSLEIGRPYD